MLCKRRYFSNAKNKYGLSEGELGTDSDELCLEPIREEELCQIS